MVSLAAMWKLLKADNTPLGLALGILAPVAGFFLYYLVRFYPHHLGFYQYLLLFRQNHQLIPAVMSISVLANAVIFFLYTQYKKDLTAKGILVATLLYALVVVLLKV
jgi:hypothetical protein